MSQKYAMHKELTAGALVHILHEIDERGGPAAQTLPAATVESRIACVAAGEVLFRCPVAAKQKNMKAGEGQHAPR
jgi:hypothetical protein